MIDLTMLKKVFTENYKIILLYSILIPVMEEFIYRFMFYNVFYDLENILNSRILVFIKIFLMYMIIFFYGLDILKGINSNYHILISLLIFSGFILFNFALKKNKLPIMQRLFIINSIIFLLVHYNNIVYQNGTNIFYRGPMYLIFSMILNVIFQKYKSTDFTIFFHICWNFWFIIAGFLISN